MTNAALNLAANTICQSTNAFLFREKPMSQIQRGWNLLFMVTLGSMFLMGSVSAQEKKSDTKQSTGDQMAQLVKELRQRHKAYMSAVSEEPDKEVELRKEYSPF